TYGLGRIVLAVLFEGLHEEAISENETRIVLRIKPFLAPVKANILPLIKKRHADLAMEICGKLRRHFMVQYDDSGSIGKRYRRGDAIGVPFAITVDDDTLENGTVTVRDRDTMRQSTIPVEELIPFLYKMTHI
ncbi:MAG: glycine--tRNA ligase, partial [Lachnospiraceae bacterium]|nr:glycine--tRNA ligase [Lachnospiraceae bacterium]